MRIDDGVTFRIERDDEHWLPVARAALDTDEYPTAIKVDNATMAALNLTSDKFHGDWNYAIAPIESAQIKKIPGKLRPEL